MAAPDQWEAEGYRAIGRWIVEFSRLIGGMRTNMENRLRKEGDDQQLPSLVFARAEAGQITDSFFGMCRLVGNLDDAEKNIANQLQGDKDKGVLQEIALRNKIAHGDWIMGRGNEPESVEAYLFKIYAKEPYRREVRYRAEDLDRLSDRLHELRGMVWLFGLLALGLPVLTPEGVKPGGTFRVSDILIAENVPRSGKGGQVAIAGPRASEIFL